MTGRPDLNLCSSRSRNIDRLDSGKSLPKESNTTLHYSIFGNDKASKSKAVFAAVFAV